MARPARLMHKPRQGPLGLFNISFGFFGIQVGFALQNANMSRIFQSMGENLDDLALLWIAAPLTGLLIQPIVGHCSDRTWGRFGRRRPYFIVGALLSAASLFAMPNASGLLAAALLLWTLDASLNIAMEPFRAFVGDMLHPDQHIAGYALQTAFIGAGAVVGSATPFLLDRLGVHGAAAAGGIADTVRYSFYLGGAVLFVAVMWTVLATREYTPAELAAFDGRGAGGGLAPPPPISPAAGAAWVVAGLAIVLIVALAGIDRELHLLGLLAAGYGLAQLVAARLRTQGRVDHPLVHIVGDLSGMPPVMRKLALAQFFTWSALFVMWIYTTPVVAQYAFGSADPASAAYDRAANWVGILFAAYNLVAAIVAALLLRPVARRIGTVRTHVGALLIGAMGFLSFLAIRDPYWLLLPEVAIGIAWASILAMPYAILASRLPQGKRGVYMGLFNVFVVVPQLLVAMVIGAVVRRLCPHAPIWTMAFAAAAMVLAAAAMLRVREAPDPIAAG